MNNAPTFLTSFWFMDWFGHLLNFNQDEKHLFRQPFAAHDYPDFFALLPSALNLPSRVVFRQKSGIPELPQINLVRAPEGWSGLQRFDTSVYLTINPRNDSVWWGGRDLLAWDWFMPVTKDFLNGLSLLTDENLAEVRNSDGDLLPLLEPGDVGSNGGGVFRFGDFHFSMVDSHDLMARIAKIEPGETKNFSVESVNGRGMLNFSVKRKFQDNAEG